jgi:hypothetical protein
MKFKTSKTTYIVAIASALFLVQASFALAQLSPSGPGTANPGAPGLTPSQPPSGRAVQSTTPTNQGPAATSSGGTVGRSGRATRLEDPKEDPVVQETEREVSKRIKNICKGC